MEEQNPYRGPDAVVAQLQGVDELAGRGTRFGAAFLDGIILLVIIVPLMYLGGYWKAAMSAAQAGQQVSIGLTLTWAAVGFLVFVLVQGFPLHASGQTWGKRVTSIKIVDLDGNKPALGRLLGLRYLPVQLVTNVPLVGPLVALVNVLLIFRADHRCGHDLIAGTRVVVAR